MDLERITMKLIVESGNSRSKAMEAIAAAKEGKIGKARELHEEAVEKLTAAHEIQADIIQAESDGEITEISVLLVHAQDHIMNAILLKDLSLEFIDLYEKLGGKG